MQYLLSLLITALVGVGAISSPLVGANLRIITVPQGGTGTSTITAAGVVYGNGTSAIRATAACADGEIIKYSSGVPACGTDTSGVGGSITGLSTTTPLSDSNVLVYSSSGAGAAYGVATGTVSAGVGISLDSSIRSVIGGALQITNSSPLSGLTANFPFSFSNPILTWLGLSTTTDSGMSAGNLYVGSGGIFQTAASSSIFGYTPLNPTRQLTIAGTAQQLTSSAGAQTLEADRTWTLSFPSHVVFPGSINAGNSTTTNATSTSLAVLNLNAASCDVKASTSGVLSCGTDADGGGGAYPFIPDTNFGVLVQATTGIPWFQNGLTASSTSRFYQASTTNFTISGNLYGGASGTDKMIQFKDGTDFAGAYGIFWDKTLNSLQIYTDRVGETGPAPAVDIYPQLYENDPWALSAVATYVGTGPSTLPSKHVAVYAQTNNNSGQTVDLTTGFLADSNQVTSGTTVSNNGLFVADQGGVATNNYGIQVADQTPGANNWAIKTGLGKIEFGDRASTTLISANYASSTLYFGAGLANCSSENMLTWTNGRFGCESDTSGAGGSTPDSKWATSTNNAIYPSGLTNSVVVGTTTQYFATDVCLLCVYATSTTGDLIFASSTAGFAGNLINLQNAAGFSVLTINNSGDFTLGDPSTGNNSLEFSPDFFNLVESNVSYFNVQNSGGFPIIELGNSDISLTNTSNKLAITGGVLTNDNDVGIATTTPEARLDVWGANSGKIATFFSNTGTKFLELLNTGVATVLGAWDFGGATSVEIPNGTGPTVDATGEIAVDTTGGQFAYFDGIADRRLSATTTKSFNIASSTLDAMGNRMSNGTSTFQLMNSAEPLTLLGFYCVASTTGSVMVRFGDGANWTTEQLCTSGAYTVTTSNNTFTSFEAFMVQASSTASTNRVQRVTVTPHFRFTVQ